MTNRYRSGFERTIAAQLEAAGVHFTYEKTELPYSVEHVYTPDYRLSNGIIIEAKGYFRQAGEITKYRAIRKAYPELDIRFLFMDASQLVLRTKSTHGEWADRNGYPWAEGRIPEDWLKT